MEALGLKAAGHTILRRDNSSLRHIIQDKAIARLSSLRQCQTVGFGVEHKQWSDALSITGKIP